MNQLRLSLEAHNDLQTLRDKQAETKARKILEASQAEMKQLTKLSELLDMRSMMRSAEDALSDLYPSWQTDEDQKQDWFRVMRVLTEIAHNERNRINELKLLKN